MANNNNIRLFISWLFFLFFFIISIYSSLFGNLVVVCGQCLSHHQQSLLLRLKHTLVFDSARSKVLVQWNESSDCCAWPGITCDHEGRVTVLKLSNESISGGIDDDSTLFDLVHLKSLDLSFNFDYSNLDVASIPSRIGNLTNLSYLNLSNSAFVGQIPNEISRLNKLVTLDLSSKEFSLLESPNFSMVIHNLTKLEGLYLDEVNISASGNEWGKALSSSLPNLRVLSLIHCSLSGPIDHSLPKLQSLSVIQLDSNYDLQSSVPEFFAYFSNLTSLSLSNCGFNGTFPGEIFQVPTLRILDISENELLDGFFPEFPPHSDLQSLVIYSTSFRGRLPASIGNLHQLSRLYLANCFFNGTLPMSIAKLTQLVHLDLSSNNFTGPIPSFHMLKNLKEVHLSSNRFAGPIPSAHWEGLSKLVIVDLSNNSLNGNIPSSIFSLPSLEKIDLSNNQFNSQFIEFPIEPALSMLHTVDLSRNRLQGPIPMSIFKLTRLVHLSLSSNNFIGTIQLLAFFQKLPVLYSLDLSYNNFSVNASSTGNSNFSSLPKFLGDLRLASCKLGTFPDMIRNHHRFSYLDLSNNQIHGEIPNWIWKIHDGVGLISLNLSHNHLVSMQEPYSLENIEMLDLSFNQIHGMVPILQPFLSYVDLSSNHFTSIPLDIGMNLDATLHFSLSNNSLTGVIPESLCNASKVQVLDLSNNNFSGRIPMCLLALSGTVEVNLRGNNLSGPIPDVFSVYCKLRALDLNGNLLTGRIPKSLANCTYLEVLNLGNNQILDTFPLLLKSISTLRVLVLRSNKFYGRFTCGESIGYWPEIRIVNIASNNFSGQLPGQCLTKWRSMMVQEDDELHRKSPARDVYDRESYSVWFSYNYEDAVTVTNKHLEMELLKIPVGFTCIDFSSNNFHGEIPNELGLLKFLHVLNLSNNALSGHIPSSFGNIQQLESLDLSRNHLNGEIPESFSNLNFLSVLDLSYNQLVGRIPKGNQMQTFSADCFQGNEGLCGPPLTPNCGNDVPDIPDHEARNSNSGSEIQWDLISVEVGFFVGFGTVIGPLVLSRRWRKYYFDRIEDILFSILPLLLLKKWLSWKMGTRK